jgi:hypothetical protein
MLKFNQYEEASRFNHLLPVGDVIAFRERPDYQNKL